MMFHSYQFMVTFGYNPKTWNLTRSICAFFKMFNVHFYSKTLYTYPSINLLFILYSIQNKIWYQGISGNGCVIVYFDHFYFLGNFKVSSHRISLNIYLITTFSRNKTVKFQKKICNTVKLTG